VAGLVASDNELISHAVDRQRFISLLRCSPGKLLGCRNTSRRFALVVAPLRNGLCLRHAAGQSGLLPLLYAIPDPSTVRHSRLSGPSATV